MRYLLTLPAVFAAFLPLAAEAQIKNLASNSSANCSIQGEGSWVRSFPEGGSESVLFKTEEFPFSFSQSSLPPSPRSFSQLLTAPPAESHPGFTWAGGIQPSINYSFNVPNWSTTAGKNGELASAVMRYEVNVNIVTGAPDLSYCNTVMAIFFELTEPMVLSHSGGGFMDVFGSSVDISQHLDSNGCLLPGNYIYAALLNPASCALELSLMPPSMDSDGDGLSDADEISIHHTDPTKADTDGDGLTDKEEIQIVHSDPLVADTDGDGFMDGFEWKSGKSPTDPLSFPVATISIHPAIELRVSTKLGTNYRVQSSVDMQTWIDADTVIEGTGTEVRRIFEAVDGGAKFWRVREED